jgi:phosphoglucosamine mutase
MTNLFGTDGIRGTVDVDLPADLVTDVGRALAIACQNGALGPSVERPRIVVGRDTRPSGPRLMDAFTTGLQQAGADALIANVLPTPGVAFLTAALGADAGVVISASHNPPQDNGIKIFARGGWKLALDAERTIEELIGTSARGTLGAVEEVDSALEMFVDHLTAEAGRLDGLRVVLDCANGAAYRAAPEALRRLGADVVALNATDDGSRINDGCGALHPEVVAAAARENDAIGITLDGDADRVLLTDETGDVVDGDAIIAVLASHLRATGRLMGDGIVVTVMANQALRQWCRREGVELVETSVGDRYVLEMLRAKGLVLGGEQSGHIVVLDRATTGDGVLVAIEVLEAVRGAGPLAGIVPFRPIPQVLVNVPTNGAAMGESVRAAVAKAEARLAGDGRILVRKSGTESVVRVMVEATDSVLAAELAESVAAAIRQEST